MAVAVLLCILAFPFWFLHILLTKASDFFWFGKRGGGITVWGYIGFYFGGLRRQILAAIRRDPFYKEPW
jgi:hypothetical protein